MAEDEAKILAEAKKLPYTERASHKNWKVRSEAFDDVKTSCQRVFSEDDPVLNQFAPLFTKGLGDTNVAALDKVLDALLVFLEKCSEGLAARVAVSACSAIGTKVLKQRPATVKKAADVLLAFVELEQQAAVTEALVKAFTDKVPKVVIAAVDLLTQAVSSFGCRVMLPQPIIKALPVLFEAKQEPVREGAKKLTVELCQWIGPDVINATLVEKMPETMKKDVEKLVADAGVVRKRPERMTRKEQAEQAAKPSTSTEQSGESSTAGAAVAEEVAEGMDPYDFADPIDVTKELNKEFWDGLAAKKWTERRDALQRLKAAASTPKIAPGDFSDLMRELKKVIVKDSNIVCVTEAIGCLGALAQGLRSNFSNSSKSFCDVLLDKFKDKNTNCCRAVADTLTAMHKHCFSLTDIAEDIAAALDHKNPKVKVETLKLLQEFVAASAKPAAAKVHAQLLPVVAKSANEPAPEIREAALATLIAFALKAGSMVPLDKVMDKLDDSRKKKLEEAMQEARKMGTPPKPGARPAAGMPSPRGSPAVGRAGSQRALGGAGPADDGEPKALGPRNINAPKPTPARAPSMSKKPAAGPAPAKGKGAAGAGASSSAGPADEDDASLAAGSLSKAEAEEKLVELAGEAVVAGLRSADWKARLGAMEGLRERMAEMKENLDACVGPLIQAVSYLPGWTEKNFQVLGKVFELITYLANESSTLRKNDAFVALGGLSEKMSDIKLKGPAGEALTAISEAIGPQFVFAQLHKKAAAHKNPKVLSESLTWMASAVEEFGLATLNVKALIDWMKADLASSNATIRNAAIALLACAHKQLGPGLANMIRPDVKPALMTALDDAFSKNPQQQVVPTRKVRRGGRPKGGGGMAAVDVAEEAPAPEFNPDDLLPRADISGQVTPRLLAALGNANWKERQGALEELEGILQAAGGRIQPTLGDLMPALKNMMKDTNRNLTARTLQLLGELAKAMGPAFERVGRPVLPACCATISDTKSQVRIALVAMLDAWISAVPADKVVPAVAEAVQAPKASADGKVAGLRWLKGAAEAGKLGGCLGEAARCAVLGCQDKTAEAREVATQLMAALVAGYKPEELSLGVNSLDSTMKKAAQELIQKHGGKLVQASAPMATPAAPVAESSDGGDGSKMVGRAPSMRASKAGPLRASRAGPLPGKPPGAGPSTSAVDEGGAACLVMNNRKDERANKGRFTLRAGRFEGLREDEEEAVEAELAPLASEPLRRLLFARGDFKRHIEAADLVVAQLTDGLDGVAEAAIAALDLLLRWVVLRLCDGNTQCLLKVLELARCLLQVLAEAGGQLSEYEAQAFLPALVEKAGHNQDRIRALHRELLRECRAVLPAPRVVDFCALGLGSKNMRTRCEACEAIGEAIADEGIMVCDRARSKPLVQVAQNVSERDKGIRAAALATLEVVYVHEGEAIWKLVGKVTDQQRSLIEERIKSADKSAARRGEVPGQRRAERLRAAGLDPAADPDLARLTDVDAAHRPLAHSASLRASPIPQGAAAQAAAGGPGLLRSMTLGFTEYDGGAATASTPPPFAMSMVRGQVMPGSGPYIPTPVPAASPGPSLQSPTGDGPAAPSRSNAEVAEQWARGIEQFKSPELRDSVEGMKVLCYELMEAVSGRASSASLAIFAAASDMVVSQLSHKLHEVFEDAYAELATSGAAPPARACKYTLNTLMQVFSVPALAAVVAQGSLRAAISAILVRLLDERVVGLQEGQQLLRALNVLMLKLLDNSTRTYSFAALLALLRCPPEEVVRAGPEALARFSDLVVKCLIKVTKTLAFGWQDISFEEVLVCIHDFFMGLGVDEIRRRGAEDDKPLRMVKTILHELCKIKGADIRQHMTGIPNGGEPAPIIHAYVELNLKNLREEGLIPPSPTRQPQGARAAAAPPAAAPAAAGPQPTATAQRPAVVQPPAAGLAMPSGNLPSPPGSATSSGSGNQVDTKARLAAIFKKIGDKASTEQGLQELWFFQRDFPAVDISPHMAKTSPAFRQYIERGLHKVEKRMKGEAVILQMPTATVTATLAATSAGKPGLGAARPAAASEAHAQALEQRILEMRTRQSSAASTPRSAITASSTGSPSRLDALRERMDKISATGRTVDARSNLASGGNRADAAPLVDTMEALQQRMNSLRTAGRGLPQL